MYFMYCIRMAKDPYVALALSDGGKIESISDTRAAVGKKVLKHEV